MTIDIAALKTDILTGPLAGELAPLSDAEQADVYNTIRVGTNYDVASEAIKADVFFGALMPEELVALTTQELQILQLVLAVGTVNLSDTNTRTILTNMFGAVTTTRANLIALKTRSGTRAEKLFGAGERVTPSQVADAKRA